MSAMYKAIQVTKPGEFATVMKPLVDPGPGQVRIRVEASGVCHSDAGTVEGSFAIDWPRVPGHEVVGRIDALGSGVQGWAVGQRVGVCFFGGSCGYCEFCRNGDLVNCRNQEFTGIDSDGGYAEVMIIKPGVAQTQESADAHTSGTPNQSAAELGKQANNPLSSGWLMQTQQNYNWVGMPGPAD